MRLYYMTSLQTAQLILSGRKLRISTFDRLNDIFELSCHNMSDKVAKQVIRYVRDKITPQIGILCFGRSWESPVMWGHYADRHQGVCLGFDVPDEIVRVVKYEAHRIPLSLDPEMPLGRLTHPQLTTILCTKYKHWEYENEMRVLFKLDNIQEDGYSYCPFSDEFQLREIIIGANCNKRTAYFVSLLKGSIQTDVIISKARPAFGKFRMVTQKATKKVTVVGVR